MYLAEYLKTTGIVVILQTISLFSNKYVLSVLGFRYPMVFQGWQTLLGFIAFKFLTFLRSDRYKINSLDKSGFISLFPTFLFFTTSLISGSKALANVDILVFAAASTLIPSSVLLLSEKVFSFRLVSSIVVLLTGSIYFLYSWIYHSKRIDGAYVWLLIHVFSHISSTFHGRIADVRYGPLDRLYYGYLFSLIVLCPISVYLEEAFEALNFEHRRQLRFLGGALCSGVASVAFSLVTCMTGGSLAFDELPAPHHIGLLVASVMSLVVFDITETLPWWMWFITCLCLLFFPFVPSHFKTQNDFIRENDRIASEFLIV